MSASAIGRLAPCKICHATYECWHRQLELFPRPAAPSQMPAKAEPLRTKAAEQPKSKASAAPQPPADPQCTPKLAAKKLGITIDSVYNLIASGSLPAEHGANGFKRIRLSDLETFARQRKALRNGGAR